MMPAAHAAPSTLFIAANTPGTAGGYIDSYRRHLARPESAEFVVSHYFPFSYGKRLFYKYSELVAQPRYRLGRLRAPVRFAELAWALSALFLRVRRSRVPTVVYSLTSGVFIEYLFLAAVRRFTQARVVIICHDVIPFGQPGKKLDAVVRARGKFYQVPHGLIVHGNAAFEELEKVFRVPRERISQFPYPLFELDAMSYPVRHVLGPAAGTRFVFLGHFRPEKGLDLLLDAWRRVHAVHPEAELVLAGQVPAGTHYDFASLNGNNVTLLSRYISDEEYINLLREADCVVLPYRRGTNSGVLSTAFAVRKPVIVSDIGLFAEHELVPPESRFRTGDAQALAERMNEFITRAPEVREAHVRWLNERLAAYTARFKQELNACFEARATASAVQ